MSIAFCRHKKVRTTCPDCKPDPKRDFLNSLGPVASHALSDVVRSRPLKPHQLPFIEYVGEGSPERVPIAGAPPDEFWKRQKTLYPGGSPHSREWKWLRELVLERDGRTCCVCRSTSNLQVDHIMPLSKGGANTFRNLWTLCVRCHSAKTQRTLDSPNRFRTAAQKEVADLLKGRGFVSPH